MIVKRLLAVVLLALGITALAFVIGGEGAVAQTGPEGLDPSHWGNAQTIVPVYDTVWDLGVSARVEEVEEYTAWLADEGFSGFATTYLGAIHRPAVRDDQPNFFTRPDPYGNPIATWDAATDNLILGAAHADRFEQFLDAAHAEGQRVQLFVIWERKAVDEFGLINEGNAYNWAHQMGTRFGNHPAIQTWLLGGDAETDNPRTTLWNNAAAGLRDAGITGEIGYGTGSAPQRRINNLNSSWNEGQFVQTSHCGTPDLIDERISRVVNLSNIPVWAGEMRYEAINATWCNPAVPIPGANEVRADALAAIDAGAAGIVYGHNDRWQWGHGALGGQNGGWNAVRASFSAPGHTAVLNALAGTPPNSTDTTPPLLTLTTPTPGSTIDSGVVSLTGNAADPGSGVAAMTAIVTRITGGATQYWNGNSWVGNQASIVPVLSDNRWSLSGVNLDQDAVYTVTLSGVDNDGNSAAPNGFSFTVMGPDVTAPVVVATSPTNGDVLTPNASATISGTATDDVSVITLTRVRIRRTTTAGNEFWSGSDWQGLIVWHDVTPDSNGAWSLGGVDLSTIASYTINTIGRDGVGNVSTAVENPFVNFSVAAADDTGPVVSLDPGLDGADIAPDGAFDITGTVTDQSAIDFVRLRIRRLTSAGVEYWNGGSWVSSVQRPFATVTADGTWVLPDVDLSQSGSYVVHLLGRDSFLNVSNATANGIGGFDVVSSDSQGPLVEVTAPTERQIFGVGGAPMSISGTSSDPSGVDLVRVPIRRTAASGFAFWDGSQWVSSSVWLDVSPDSSGNWQLSGVQHDEVGAFRIQLSGFDGAGNVSTATDNGSHLFFVR